MTKKGNILLAAVSLMIFMMPLSCSAATFYNIKAKDTLWKIAKEYNVSVDSILRANPDMKNERDLKTGATIVIPEASEEVIPTEDEVTNTSTLIIHGGGKAYNTPQENAVNVMTVDGKSIRVPSAVKPAPVARKVASAGYRSKYHNMSSRRRYAGSMAGNAIVAAAFKFMGVPYVFGGTTPRGFDCSGFVQYVFAMNGIKTPRMAHHQFYAGTPIPKNQIKPGDLVFFETYTVGISHVGIYIGDQKFIHASSSGSVTVSDLNKPYYVNRYRGAARY